jgi:hypothetical protein
MARAKERRRASASPPEPSFAHVRDWSPSWANGPGSRTRTAQSGFPYKFFARVVSSADGLGGAFMGCAPSPTFRRTPRSGRRACDEDLAELRVSIRALGLPLTVRSAAMDFAPVWSPRLLRTESAGRRREAKLTDKQHLEAMLTALDASLRALERIDDWQIVGNNGHIMTDGRGFVFYVSTSESPRRWTGIKKRLGFCRLTQDGNDEGW